MGTAAAAAAAAAAAVATNERAAWALSKWRPLDQWRPLVFPISSSLFQLVIEL